MKELIHVSSTMMILLSDFTAKLIFTPLSQVSSKYSKPVKKVRKGSEFSTNQHWNRTSGSDFQTNQHCRLESDSSCFPTQSQLSPSQHDAHASYLCIRIEKMHKRPAVVRYQEQWCNAEIFSYESPGLSLTGFE